MVSIVKADVWQNGSGAAYNSIIQVVTGTVDPGSTSTTSSTFIDSGLSATITPKFINSKILVLVCHWECYVANSNSAINIQLVRNGTILGDGGDATLGYIGTGPNYFNVNLHYVDSPSSVSAVTYKTQFRSRYGGSNAVALNSDNTTSYITLMEIAQ